MSHVCLAGGAGAVRRRDEHAACDRTCRTRYPAAREPGTEHDPLAQAGAYRRDAERDRGGHGRAAACGRGQERSLEGGRRGGGGKQRRPGRPRQRAERTGIADQHDGRKHDPTGQNPGAADRDRSRRGARQDLGRADGSPQQPGRQDQEDRWKTVSLHRRDAMERSGRSSFSTEHLPGGVRCARHLFGARRVAESRGEEGSAISASCRPEVRTALSAGRSRIRPSFARPRTPCGERAGRARSP